MKHATVHFGIDVVIPRIVEIGMARIPYEACGIVVPNLDVPASEWVVEMENKADNPLNSYKIDSATIRQIVSDPSVWDDVLIWHTHPSGSPSPSQADWEGRLPGLKYLVVALPSGQADLF